MSELCLDCRREYQTRDWDRRCPRCGSRAVADRLPWIWLSEQMMRYIRYRLGRRTDAEIAAALGTTRTAVTASLARAVRIVRSRSSLRVRRTGELVLLAAQAGIQPLELPDASCE